MKIIIRIALCFLPFNLFAATNLLINPDAETKPTSSGWTQVSAGSNCNGGSGWRIQGNQGGYPAANSGDYIFFAGCGSSGEIYQDINVSLNALNIDAGLQTFTISGYMQSYDQPNPDGAEMIMEFRNATNTIVLASYTSGVTHNISVWGFYSNTAAAPAGTRNVRVRLKATLNAPSSNDGYFDNLSLTTNVPLPIQLNSFEAQPKENKIEISWSTASESNNNFFTIERSTDAVNWVAVTEINGATNSSSSKSYSASDDAPITGTSYYRLKQTDVDGTSTFSTDLIVNNTLGQLIIFPQPASDKLEINTGNVQDIQAELFNSYGQIVKTIQSSNSATVQLDVSTLEAGVYYISITLDNGKQTQKILISR